MLNKKNEAVLFQEPNTLNKPHVLVKIALSKSLSARDKKIYNIFIRELLTLNETEYKDNEIRLSISKLSHILDVSTRNDLYKSIEKLMNTIITFEEEYTRTRAVMISSYTRPVETLLEYDNEGDLREYNPDNLIIRFDTKLTSKIVKYADKYAKLDLEDINKIPISHGITLYEIFIKSMGKYTYQKINLNEAELRKYLHLEDKYKSIKDFNRKVIKQSIEDINENTKLSVIYKRVKEKGINIYKFEVNQDYRYNFKRFKKTIIENYTYIEFKYKNNKYVFAKDEDDKKAQWLICNARTFKTIQTGKAEEIYNFMYELLNKRIMEFVNNFIIEKDLDIKDFDINNLDENDIEEAELFQDYYNKTI